MKRWYLVYFSTTASTAGRPSTLGRGASSTSRSSRRAPTGRAPCPSAGVSRPHRPRPAPAPPPPPPRHRTPSLTICRRRKAPGTPNARTATRCPAAEHRTRYSEAYRERDLYKGNNESLHSSVLTYGTSLKVSLSDTASAIAKAGPFCGRSPAFGVERPPEPAPRADFCVTLSLIGTFRLACD
ncbi:hypothetical protein EVAR_6941_1 [Eumeta japonica]|uniref:Uncharacterized protein n=1 Tax=Eumeta variegata TaxID=151549 RepID=A0A4C1TGJ1_EUMVA|nr:hypothetical protein EVAR_6941_1 [Eumeta japonica]